jgi:hypothetical protein
MDSEHYCAMLQTLWAMELRRARNVWFQQDGAMAITARQSMTSHRGMFPGCLISRFGDIPWPPHSLDLTALEFFLWGYLKSKVYATCPHSTQELTDRITEGIASCAELQKAMYWMACRSSGTCKAQVLNCHHYASYSIKFFTSFITQSLTVAYWKPSHPHNPPCAIADMLVNPETTSTTWSLCHQICFQMCGDWGPGIEFWTILIKLTNVCNARMWQTSKVLVWLKGMLRILRESVAQESLIYATKIAEELK